MVVKTRQGAASLSASTRKRLSQCFDDTAFILRAEGYSATPAVVPLLRFSLGSVEVAPKGKLTPNYDKLRSTRVCAITKNRTNSN